jgi:hypothetical protein
MTTKYKLLQTIKQSLQQRPLVILDLDNTCVCAVEMEDIKKVKNPTQFRHVDLENVYRIYERPGLQSMLDILFTNYQVAVWTAAGLTYALFVIQHFIINNHDSRHIQFIMWDDHCDYSTKCSKQTKDMSFLVTMYPSLPMVLLDDNEQVLDQTHTINSNYFDVTKKHANQDRFCESVPELLRTYFMNDKG